LLLLLLLPALIGVNVLAGGQAATFAAEKIPKLFNSACLRLRVEGATYVPWHGSTIAATDANALNNIAAYSVFLC